MTICMDAHIGHDFLNLIKKPFFQNHGFHATKCVTVVIMQRSLPAYSEIV